MKYHRVRLQPVSSRVFSSFLVVGSVIVSPLAFGIDPFPGTVPGVEIQQSLPAGYEPSGAVWHPRLERLFVVSDSGVVSSMDENGDNVTSFYIPGDLEAICVADPDSDFVYVGVEGPPSVLELNFVTGKVQRTFDLSPWIIGLPNELMEGLTFVNDRTGGNAEGGLFYAANQGTGQIFEFLLPIKSSSSSTQVTFVDSFFPVIGWGDLSDLYYQAGSDTLWATWDFENVLRAMTPDGAILGEWTLPGDDQEGFTVAGCAAFVAEDSGKVWRYEFSGLAADTDGDGVLDCADLCPDTPPGATVDSSGCMEGQQHIVVRGSELRSRR